MSRATRFKGIFGQLQLVSVLVYQVVAIAAFVLALILASSWLRLPFLGAFFEHTLLVNAVAPSQPNEAWQLHDQGVQPGDQLVSVAGTDVRTAGQVQSVLSELALGEAVVVQLHSSDGVVRAYNVTLHAFPGTDRTTYLVIPSMISLFFLGIGLWIFGLRRNESAGRAFSVLAASLAVVIGTLLDLFTTHYLTHVWTLACAMVGGAMIDLALSFPQEAHLVTRFPVLRWLGYLAALGLTGYAYTTLFNFEQPAAYILSWQAIYVFAGVAGIFFLGVMSSYGVAARSPVSRSQARTILIGALFAFGPILIWLLLSSLDLIAFTPYLLLPIVLFPLVTGYTILRLRQVKTDYVLRRGIMFVLLTVLVSVTYALIVGGLSLIFGTTISAANPWLIGTLVCVMVFAFNPLRSRMLNLVNSIFFRGEQAYQTRVQEFTHALTATVDLVDVVRSLRSAVMGSLIPERLHIYVYDPLSDQYAAMAAEDGQVTSDIRFSVMGPLAQAIGREQLPLFLNLDDLPAALRPEQSRLVLLGAYLIVPLHGSERLIGWLALGERRSGEEYTAQDITFLDLLSDQAAVAVERAQVVFDMERRVREMNILSRVAQGVNVTVNYDDILELIYAQTDQILPVDDFHLTLHNEANDYFYFAFCLEEDDRLTERENTPLPPNQGLSPEVVRNRRPIVTGDYSRECQMRGIEPSTKGSFAWAGVPLNAGAETIGALSIASRDPAVTYTAGQLNLLQAIADQAAGAIVKARLLQETERRAYQLATLNEITRQLTSTLETEPLLQNILHSAMGILNCEAGSLFMVDGQTDELVFMVTAGPVAGDLIGQRLPPGSGIVGKAVQTRLPVIENDAQRSPSWFNTDKKTGFVTRTLLAVPMMFKERVIGVLEVINRRDGLPFIEDDQNLLSAFASQAAVAIENARLYTLTDQELSVRVEELSVMQRIDRELNASLDVSRAMHITLEWAMCQSGADAGLIGILEEKGVRVMAEQGYKEALGDLTEDILPLSLPSMEKAIESGQPQRIVLNEEENGLLFGARSQTVVPIRREANAIGLILLESRTPDSRPEQEMNFLNRLGDHAAIAIANAQLYSEVQEANIAKSEFVSFVAHEIKNPMTSIKGYAELLTAGAVGPINEMQANFLNTIRSNVERMSTLVSDLNDNSKIEAGRLRLEFKGVDFSQVVEEVTRSNSRLLEEKKQELTLKLPAELPRVWADSMRLEQVLTNLVSNANKYTPEGGQITIGAEKVRNQWDPEGAAEVAHVWVRDNGIGISLEDQKKIFQKFFRSDDQKAREVPGTGLGLNITRSLVEMQGGRIWFESEYRKGTTFHFTVPVAEE